MPAVDYAPGEISRIGAERYEQELRVSVENEDNLGKILVIDIETGDSEIAADQATASARLRERRPEGAFYVVRIGYSAVEKIGGSWRSLRR